MKDDIILNPQAYSFQVGEQLHARNVHSLICKASTKWNIRPLATKGNKKGNKLGNKLANRGDKALGRRTRLPTKVCKK